MYYIYFPVVFRTHIRARERSGLKCLNWKSYGANLRNVASRGVFRGEALAPAPPPLKVKKIDGGRAIEALETRGPPDSIV